jgi:hypothetical protein
MKNYFYVIITALFLFNSFNSVNAQAWERNSKVLSLGFGASQFFHLDDYYYLGGNKPRDFRAWHLPITGQINFQGEFGVHKYVGLGFTTGIGGGARGPAYYGYNGEINAPIGFIVNFHFYQLIEDNTQKNIHGDKLDIYAGLNIGSGIAVSFYPDGRGTRVVPIAFGGPHVGIRYYFSPRVGVNGELGFGKSLINAGFVFKL